MEGFRFQSPWMFLFLLLFVGLAWRSFRSTTGARLKFSVLTKTREIIGAGSGRKRLILPVLRCLALLLFIFALARPQWGTAVTNINTEAVDVLLVLDTSGSMQALDFYLDKERVMRLDAVKDVVGRFIRNRPQDRLGMVVFGAEAFTQCPQTLDHGVLLNFLDQVEIGMAGDATAVGSAIGIGVKRLKDLDSKSKVMILLTDGRSNAGQISPLGAAKIAQTFGIKIYTIGVGSQGKAPFMVQGFFGKQLIYQEVDLDEKTLKEIARVAGGQYFRATDTESLHKIYAEIDQLEKTKVEAEKFIDYREYFLPFIGFGLFLLIGEVVLGQTRFRKLP